MPGADHLFGLFISHALMNQRTFDHANRYQHTIKAENAKDGQPERNVGHSAAVNRALHNPWQHIVGNTSNRDCSTTHHVDMGQAQIGEKVAAVIRIAQPVGNRRNALESPVYGCNRQRQSLGQHKLYQNVIVPFIIIVAAQSVIGDLLV